MLQYLIKRIALAIVTVLAVMLIVFFAMNSIPGGPFDTEKAPSPEVKAQMMANFNLDKPIFQQFLIYTGKALKGDFGVSIKTGRPIIDTISKGFAISAIIGLQSIMVALIIGVIFGCLSALYKNSWFDKLIAFFSTLFVSVPNFIIGSVLLLFFCLKLKWVPVWDAVHPNYILPVISLALYPMATIIRYTRAGMLDSLGQNYIKTARAKGVSELKITMKHALRNAAIPVITYIGPMAANVLTGSVVIETIFTIGGMGSLFITGISNRDYTLIMGTTIFFALIIVTINLLSDILYKVIDPRIKFE